MLPEDVGVEFCPPSDFRHDISRASISHVRFAAARIVIVSPIGVVTAIIFAINADLEMDSTS